MEPFRQLFGLDASAVGETCVLLPFSRKRLLQSLGVGRLNRGFLYSAAPGDLCTVILTRVGAVFAGDAVLHLADTPCKEIIFLGTCGLVPPAGERGIGSLVCPSPWYGQESFSRLAAGDLSPGPRFFPDPDLRRALLRSAGLEAEDGPAGVSFGSLRLQPELLPAWRGRGVEAVDLESAAVLAAAARTGRKAAALLAVGDIVGPRPYHQPLTPEEESRLGRALDRAVESVCCYIGAKTNA